MHIRLVVLLLLSLPTASMAAAGGGVDVSSLVRLIIGLVVVIAAVVGLAWFLRRLGGIGQHADGQLRVLAGLAVGQRERVVLIQVGEEQVLIGVAPGRVQTLHVLEQPITEIKASSDKRRLPPGSSFAERLRRAMQQQNEQR